MKLTTPSLLLLLSLFISGNGLAATYNSGETRNTLIELYTSEGCSSCPRADRWLSKLKQHPRLWKDIFPVAFHVDYWDYLGWKDRFAKKTFSARQRSYATFGYIDTAYTPGFVQNGREWRGWFYKPSLATDNTPSTGRLSASVTPELISVSFKPTLKLVSPSLNIAILAFNQTSQIHSGENAGKRLYHDFVAISHHQYNAENNHWTITDQSLLQKLGKGAAIIFWVTDQGNPTPIQVTGGWL